MLIDDTNLLNFLGLQPFAPIFPFRHPHLQTTVPVWLPQRPDSAPQEVHQVVLSDGDSLVIVDNKPAGWDQMDRTVIMTHGLTGSHQSNYMVRLCQKFLLAGYRVLRVNQRGCGPGFGLAGRSPHSGRSEDFREIVLWYTRKFPRSSISLVGFSLGANVLLKMAGEDGQRPTANVDSIIAVSPPLDLAKSSAKMASGLNRIFDWYFTNQILSQIKRMAVHYPHVDLERIPKRPTLNLIDEHFTAPQSGFKSAADYYAQCSSLRLLDQISIPTLILCAMDDPIVDGAACHGIQENKAIDLLLTQTGGHVGFLAKPTVGRPLRWMDDAIIKWLEVRLNT